MSVDLHHRVEGPEAAPVLVLCNSLGTTLEMWDPQADALAEHFRLLRYDSRGHGRSPVPDGPYSIADLGRDVIELLDRLGLDRASLCGLSLGGMTAMWLGIHAPERVDRLALCCTSAHMPPRETWLDRAATVRSQGMSAVAEATLERWFTPELIERRPDVVDTARQTLLATPPEGYAACCEAIAGHDLRDEIGRIAAPTLVVAGTDDPATPPDHARLIANRVEGARLVVLEHARHLASVERPDAVTRELVGHLTAGAHA